MKKQVREQIIFRPDKKIFEFEGKVFRAKTTKFKKIDGVEHEDKVIFEEFKPDEHKEKMDFIKSRLMDQIPPDKIVEEIVNSMSSKNIDKIHRLLSNKRVLIKQQHGCFGLKIDGGKRNSAYIDIFG